MKIMVRWIRVLSLWMAVLAGGAGVRAQQYWVAVPSPATEALLSLSFPDSLAGWAAGLGGTIIHTTDGGLTWSRQTSGITHQIVDIFMRNRWGGWALAHDVGGSQLWTVLLATTNGGESWQREVYPEPEVIFNSVFFSDSLRGWMVGEFGAVAGTEDGGRTWMEAVVDSPRLRWDLYGLRFLTPSYGYAVGGRFDLTGVVWRTTNGGAVWSAQVAGAEPVYDIHFIDSLNVLGIGGDTDYGSGMIRSTDAGVTWEYTYLGIWGQARAISFRTPAEGWAVLGFAGRCMVTRDTGHTWQSFFTPETSSVYDLQFTTQRRGFMVGAGGRILRFDPDAVSVTESPNLPARHRLLPPYPNPFNPAAGITFELGSRAQVRLTVHDIAGRTIGTLVDGVRGSGTHHAVFDARDCASGIYFCRLRVVDDTGVFSAGAKLLLLR